MTKAMQQGARQPSVAERGFREVLAGKYKDRRPTQVEALLEAYARTWHDEAVEEKFGNRHLTDAYFALSGRWAIDRLAEIPVLKYQDTRRYLYICIADAGFCSWVLEDAKLCIQALRDSPSAEGKLVSSAMRSVLESRYANRVTPVFATRLTQFFPSAGGAPEEHEVLRTVMKALGNYAKMEDLIVMGKVLYLLRGPQAQTLKDFVERAIKA